MEARGAGRSPKLRSPELIAAQPVLVYVICGVRLYHDTLVKLLNRQAGISAVGSTEIGEGLISSLEAIAPDTVLLDLGSPEALPFAARLVRARPCTRILGFGIDDAPLGGVSASPIAPARLPSSKPPKPCAVSQNSLRFSRAAMGASAR